jgi:N-acetylglucosaminylphosphatidylinositol deacetylase
MVFDWLEYLQFPTVWIYLMMMNVFILVMVRRAKMSGSSEEQRNENSKKTVLFITAHPDDEAMFFVPTILTMKDLGYTLHILCLSNGNADGKGKIREQELNKACKYLGFSEIFVVDDPRIPDGMDKLWEVEVLKEIIKQRLAQHNYNGIITFDKKGVSSHLNHISVCFAIQALRSDEQYKTIKMFELDTVNTVRKFIGVFDLIFSGTDALSFLNNKFWVNWKAMYAHKSQFVWFRWIFLIFSRYVYINTLTEKKFPELNATNAAAANS